MTTLPHVIGRRMCRRRWDAWHEGVFDAMEAAQRAYDRGERLPSDEHAMFWAWAHESFQLQAHHAAKEVVREQLELLEQESTQEDDAGDADPPSWDGETWRLLGQRSYAHGYSWALHVEMRRLCFGVGGVTQEDRDAYLQARGDRRQQRRTYLRLV